MYLLYEHDSFPPTPSTALPPAAPQSQTLPIFVSRITRQAKWKKDAAI